MEWQNNGECCIFRCDKGYASVIKVKNKRSYKIEVAKNGIYISLGRKQTLELAKRKVESYFGIRPIEVLRAPVMPKEVIRKQRPLTFSEEILARQERQKLSSRAQEYNSAWNMCERLPYKD